MRRILNVTIIIFLFIELFPACSNNKPECQKFRTGKFRLHVSGTDMAYSIERNDSIQTDVEEGTGKTTRLRVTWIDACSYRLAPMDNTSPLLPIKIQILETEKNYYVFNIQADTVLDDAPKGIPVDTMWMGKTINNN